MSTLRTLTVALALVTVTAAAAAAAPSLGVYFDDQASSSSATVQLNTPFDMYLVMSDVNDQANGVEWKLNLPPEVAVLGASYGGEQPLDISNQNGTLLGFGSCETIFNGTSQESFVVAHYTVMAFSSFETTDVVVTKYTGGGDGNPTATGPRYSRCQPNNDNVELSPINAQLTGPVATYSHSFGAVKALYE